MKKIVAFLLILSSFLWMFGCAKDSEWIEFQYLVQTSDASDSAEGMNIPREISLWNSTYEESSLSQRKLKMDNMPVSMTGTYKQSKVRKYEYFATHEYSCDNGSGFTVDDNGNVVGFRRHREDAWLDVDHGVLSEQECLESAKNFFATMVENVNDYQSSIRYYENYQEYMAVFVKYVDSWATADRAIVWVTPVTGEITLYIGTMLGYFEKDLKISVDKDKVNEAVNAKLKPIITKAKERYDEVECESLSYTLTRNENQYILICDAIIKYVENDGEYQLISNEMIQFVIT